MPKVTPRRRPVMQAAHTIAPVDDPPAVATVHRFVVRLAIRRLMERKTTRHVSRSRTT